MSGARGFNLLDEPWIAALACDGRERLLSIIDLFEQAPRLTMIGGEVPTQAFAITRLLLAFVHRAIDGPRDAREWAQLWAADTLPMPVIHRYAARVRHRFDLFDAHAPFFQVAGLRTEKNRVLGLEKIVADVPNNEPFFTTRSARSLRRIEPAEAARWLVHTHAFDPAGVKTGVVGDPTVVAGKGFKSTPGWSGRIGGVLVEGRDLKETLLLNLIARDAHTYVRIGGPDDLPPWERDPDGPTWREDAAPRGAIQLYTWQSRRIRLFGDRSGVTGVIVANGDKIEQRNRHGVEPHTAWRYSEPQSKKAKTTVYMPRTHDPGRSVWRGIGALLPSISPRRTTSPGPQPFLAPGVLQWIGDLAAEGYLPEDYAPRVRIQGAKYDRNASVFEEIVDDRLPVSVHLLRQDYPDTGRAAEAAVEDAEQASACLWRLTDNIAQACGFAPGGRVGDHAREDLYAALEGSYRAWLATLVPGGDLAAARAEWQATVRRACREIIAELVTTAPPAAWAGRRIDDRLVNVALAEIWCNHGLSKALPLATPRAQQLEEVTP